MSNADLLRRTSRHDPPAAKALIPYAAWCLFATALNAEIAHQNPPRPATPGRAPRRLASRAPRRAA